MTSYSPRYRGSVPSYRITLTLGALHPGTRPDAVLPAAMQAARELTTVEAGDVQVVGGRARVVVRFTGDDSEVAALIGRHWHPLLLRLSRCWPGASPSG